MSSQNILEALEKQIKKNRRRLWIFTVVVFWIALDIIAGLLFDNSFLSVGVVLFIKFVIHPEGFLLATGIIVSIVRVLFLTLLALTLAERRKLKKLRRELGQVV